MQIFSRLLVFCVLFAALASCSTSPSTDYVAITPSQVTQSATATKEAQRLPTATRRPSATPSPSPTLDLTEVVEYHDALTARSMEETLVPKFSHICDETLYISREFSPDGLWLTEFCYSPNDQDLILTISRKDSQILWKVLFQDSIPQMDMPDGWMSVVRWSNDGRFVYFYSDFGGSGGECFYKTRERGFGLFRLDLQSGQNTTILPPNGWSGFSFSPTDRRLVYGALARDLKILDMTTGKTIDIPSAGDNYETGGYLWSSDGIQLVYSTLTRDEQGERENYSLRLFDAQTGIGQILFESPENCYSASSWATNSILIIEREGRDGQALIEYDLNANNVINEFTATPYP
jgi:Tol biopolymer transport system component